MLTFAKSAALATVIFATVTATANADQVASITAGAAVTLPTVVVHPPQDYYDPYTSGTNRPSSLNHVPSPHFTVPAGYDSNSWMMPYGNHRSLCTEGGPGPCTRGPDSHYERVPFNQ